MSALMGRLSGYSQSAAELLAFPVAVVLSGWLSVWLARSAFLIWLTFVF